VKITGANSITSADNVKQQQQSSGLPARDSSAKNEGAGEGVVTTVSANTATGAVVEVTSSNQDGSACESGCEGAESILAEDDAFIMEGTTALSGMSNGNDDYLDLLVDALDGDFDPNLLI